MAPWRPDGVDPERPGFGRTNVEEGDEGEEGEEGMAAEEELRRREVKWSALPKGLVVGVSRTEWAAGP